MPRKHRTRSRHVVVFLPGILGSELQLGGQRVWPTTIATEPAFQALLDDRLVATDIIRRAFGITFYEPLIDLLDRVGYRESDRTLHVWPYDWRRDLRSMAAMFADFLDRIVAPDTGTTLLTHSMGGLIARTYLESLEYRGRPGRIAVRRLITLGTPHRGAPLAFLYIAGAAGLRVLSNDHARRLAADSRYPSIYQLLPPDNEAYLFDENGVRATLDAVPSEVAELNPASIRAMRAWRAGLDLTAGGVPIDAFATAKLDTVASLSVVLGGGFGTRIVWSLTPSGDQIVPSSSASTAGMTQHETSAAHWDIFSDPAFSQALPSLLPRRPLIRRSGQAKPPRTNMKARR
jgi:hypothetical protein